MAYSSVSSETLSIVSITMADPLLVRAVYKFKGTNNDEVRMSLNFLETSNYYVFS